MNDPATNPCRLHDCHLCCLDTRMTLTEADVARLEASGFRDFCRLDADGDLVLVNRSGRCVFLAAGRCSVYHDRPDGCRLYPLVLDVASGTIARDGLCPYREAFEVTRDAAERLERSVAQELVERRQRRVHG